MATELQGRIIKILTFEAKKTSELVILRRIPLES
jgi:hypothetical protein